MKFMHLCRYSWAQRYGRFLHKDGLSGQSPDQVSMTIG